MNSARTQFAEIPFVVSGGAAYRDALDGDGLNGDGLDGDGLDVNDVNVNDLDVADAVVEGGDNAASPLRVMFVIPGAPVGNSMIFARRQAEALARLGVSVDLFYLRTRTSPLGLVRALGTFRRRLRCYQPQVIHAHFGTVTALFAAVAAPFHPLVITFRGGDLNPAPAAAPRGDRFRSWVGRLISQLAAMRAERIICVSRQLRDRLYWRKGRACIVPSGVDTCAFFPQPRVQARQKLGWSLDANVVLFNSGGRDWIKRPALARQAVDVARRRIPELRLEEVDGSLDPQQMPVLMNAVDCLLLTSATEGSPTVVQEALACGLPVVAVRVGDTEERLAHSCGSRLAADNSKALGQALCEVLLDRKDSLREDGLRKDSLPKDNPNQQNMAPLDAEFARNVHLIASSRIAAELRSIYAQATGRIR